MSESSQSQSVMVFNDPGYGRSPTVSVDAEGRCSVAWISCGVTSERVRMSQRDRGGSWGAPRQVTSPCRFVTGLSIAPWHGGVLVAWVDGTSEKGGLKLGVVSDGKYEEIQYVSSPIHRPAHPALAADNRGFTLVWTEKKRESRQVRACVGVSASGVEQILSLSDGEGFTAYPALARARGQTVVAWQEMAQSTSSIVARIIEETGRLSERIILASHASGIVACPAVTTAASGGWWVAWQSDMDAAHGPGLVRGIEVAFLAKDETLWQPAMASPKVSRRGKGTDQGFESPSLVSLSDGRLVIIGRGSQSVRRQDLGATGWTDRTVLDDGDDWSCRGRRFSVAASLESLFVVGREKDGITARILETSHGGCEGTPELSLLKEPPAPVNAIIEPEPKQHIFRRYRVLFGDIHQHTIASDGTGTIEETFHRARYRYRDEVVAVSDHESFLGKKTPEGEWRETCRVTDELYEPGAFVTLNAFEWTGRMFPGPGHKVVYLPSGKGPLFSRDQRTTSTSRGLIQACSQIGALAIPHHVGWTGADLENHSPKVQPCFEIVSCHGAYEREGSDIIGTRGDDKKGQFIGDALDRNLRFGFVGGSDGHGLSWHHGVSRKQDSHRTGITGFFCEELTRQSVWNALKRRRCFATSGAKIVLWFEVDERPMGEEIITGTSVPFRVVISGTAPLLSVALVSNGAREMPLVAKGRNADIRGILSPPPEDGFSYYYLRVVQEDDEVAWSSPIWLDPPEPA